MKLNETIDLSDIQINRLNSTQEFNMQRLGSPSNKKQPQQVRGVPPFQMQNYLDNSFHSMAPSQDYHNPLNMSQMQMGPGVSQAQYEREMQHYRAMHLQNQKMMQR
jgi:hypothetical protein